MEAAVAAGSQNFRSRPGRCAGRLDSIRVQVSGAGSISGRSWRRDSEDSMASRSASPGAHPCSPRSSRIWSRCIPDPLTGGGLERFAKCDDFPDRPSHPRHQEDRSPPAKNRITPVGLGDVADAPVLDVFPDLVDGLQLDPAVADLRPVDIQDGRIDLLVELTLVVVAGDPV